MQKILIHIDWPSSVILLLGYSRILYDVVGHDAKNVSCTIRERLARVVYGKCLSLGAERVGAKERISICRLRRYGNIGFSPNGCLLGGGLIS